MAARILVVDDDESMCELLRMHLAAAGYEVSTALDGISAGYLVLRNPRGDPQRGRRGQRQDHRGAVRARLHPHWKLHPVTALRAPIAAPDEARWYDLTMFFRVVLCLLLAMPGLVQAQQYRWVDEKGQVRISDSPPPPTAKNVRKWGDVPPPSASEPQLPFELQRAQADFPVTLYTAPICKQPCTLAREALNRRGVPFKEVQVWNAETVDQLKALTGSDDVPALVVGRTVQSGYDSGRFDGLLDSAGYPKVGAVPARSQAAPAPPEGYQPPPTAEPVVPAAEASAKPGPYDTSGLKGPPPKPGPYDPSGLKGPPPKPGLYRLPGESK